ncbi:MAG TPA: hypothetical protein VNE16_10665 [Vicinamibacterales bacterium]|nr:hypothetical protein [Vicinamibacterales bacterium]
MRTASCVLAVAAVLLLAGRPAAAAPARGRVRRNAATPIRPHTVEISAFAGRFGGNPLTAQSALLTPNVVGSPGVTTPLFNVAETQQAAASFGGRIAYNITSMFAVEGAFTYSRPNLDVAVSNDAQAPSVPPFTIAQVHQIFVDVSLIAHLSALSFAHGRGIPFLAGGGGYLGQIYLGTNENLTGQVYNIGGGVKYFFGAPGARERFGVRGDLREYFRSRGGDNVAMRRSNLSLTGSLLFVF